MHTASEAEKEQQGYPHSEEYQKQGKEDLITYLLEHPLVIPEMQPLSREEIYDE